MPAIRTQRIAALDGVSLAYETRGAGAPALVFVHGWSCDRRYWDGQLESFSRDFEVVAIDLGGHGESASTGRDAWTVEAFGADVAAVVQALGLARVILVGHSMGGDVIVDAARRMAGRVAGLVWVDTYRSLGSPRTAEQLRAAVAPFRADFRRTTLAFVRAMFPQGANERLVERVAAAMAAAPPEVALPAMESAWGFEREMPRALHALALPVVAINPDDRPTDFTSLRSCGVDAVIMPGVGHFPMMEDPGRFNALLRRVIQRFAA